MSKTRSKAILRILSGKTRSANEERKQLRRAGVVYKHGVSANINAILAAENAAMLANARNNTRKANSKPKSKSKHNNKPKANNKVAAPKSKWAVPKADYLKKK